MKLIIIINKYESHRGSLAHSFMSPGTGRHSEATAGDSDGISFFSNDLCEINTFILIIWMKDTEK